MVNITSVLAKRLDSFLRVRPLGITQDFAKDSR
jgi:hypothetical protein